MLPQQTTVPSDLRATVWLLPQANTFPAGTFISGVSQTKVGSLSTRVSMVAAASGADPNCSITVVTTLFIVLDTAPTE